MNKIYTKTGDKGTTGLANGERVLKNSERIESYGAVDELNSVIGVCAQQLENFSQKNNLHLLQWCFAIQNDLFNLGSDLATPIESRWKEMNLVSKKEILQLEKMIDSCQSELTPLREFILPGGTLANAYLHLARTVCRRAERKVVHLSQTFEINKYSIQYLNRLSDLLFVMARYVQSLQKKEEVTWKKDGGVVSLLLDPYSH